MKKSLLLFLAGFFCSQLMAETPSPEEINTIAGQLLGTNQERQNAVTALTGIGIPAVPYVANYLTDKDPTLKESAWAIINGIGFDSVVSYYIGQLSSSDAALRLQATKVLGQAANKYFGYVADNADTVKRAAIVAKWTAWLADYRAKNPAP